MTQIPHNKPLITASDRVRVDAVLTSGWIAEGAQVAALEREFVQLLGGGAACAVSSGTAALFLALRGVGIGAGDRVAVPTYACSALLNAVHMLGGRAVPVDVREDDFNIDPGVLGRTADDVKAVIVVHCFGTSAPVAELRRPGRAVVEDCCQSLGGPQGRAGDAAIFSFYATKIVTGGQGGLVFDRNATVAESGRDYREFDVRRDYQPRFNFQTTDIAAAMVLSQLGRLDAIKERRRAIRAAYREAASGALAAGWRMQSGLEGDGYMPYRFILVAPDRGRRDRLREAFGSAGVRTIVPIERFELLHRYLGISPEAFPVAERLADTAVSLPLYPALDDAEVATICNALRRLS